MKNKVLIPKTKRKKNTMTSFEIDGLIKERLFLIKAGIGDKEVDQIQKKISNYIRKYPDEFEVDFILETWTHFGAAPQLVYDDNGYFAVTDAGYFPVVFGKQKIEGSMQIVVEKKQWKKTIREAVKYYLNAK